MDQPELRARRLIAQLLAPSAARPHPTTAHDVAAHMLATQAQNRPAGVEALSVRLGSPADVDDPAASGVVRSWSQRGTHHFLAAEDVRWMTLLCTPRVQRDQEKRRAGLGLSDGDVDRCRRALLAAASEGPVARTAAYGVFRGVGVDPGEGRGPHLLRHFGGEGDLVQGPREGSEDTFVLHDRVVPSPGTLSGDAALRELGERYLRSRGPATVRDLAWWSGLTVRDATRAADLALQGGTVVEDAVGDSAGDGRGRTVLMADWQRRVTAEEIAAALRRRPRLPAFDEYLLGYGDRSDVLAPELVPEVGPTRNGLCWPFRVASGRVTGRA